MDLGRWRSFNVGAGVIPDLSDLSDEQHRRLDEMKDALWGRVGEVMQGDGFRGEDDFNWRMSVWVQNMAVECAAEDRGLVLIAASLIERRFWTVIRMALRGETEKEDG